MTRHFSSQFRTFWVQMRSGPIFGRRRRTTDSQPPASFMRADGFIVVYQSYSGNLTFSPDASGSSEAGVRRSKRTKVPCLDYWKNERIDYERRKSGGRQRPGDSPSRFCRQLRDVVAQNVPTPIHPDGSGFGHYIARIAPHFLATT